MRAGALDARSHGDEAVREVANLGIARGVEDFGFAARETCRHQGGFGRSDGRRGQHDAAAAQPVRLWCERGCSRTPCRPRRPSASSALRCKIDRPRADRATARQRHPCRAEARQQRRQDENAGAHAAHQVVRRLRVARAARIRASACARTARGRSRRTPASCASMVSTSVTSGTFDNSSGSELSRAAAICGSTAFLAPEIWTEPSMRLPPRMTNRSMLFLSRRLDCASKAATAVRSVASNRRTHSIRKRHSRRQSATWVFCVF